MSEPDDTRPQPAAPEDGGRAVGEGEASPAADAGAPEAQARREELERLFADWDARRAAERSEPEGWRDDEDLGLDPLDRPRVGDRLLWRAVFALAVTAVSVVLMMATRHEFTYWLHRGEPPIELGDFRQQWRDGIRTLDVPSNSYVRAEGLFVTHEMAVLRHGDESESEGEGPGAEPRYKYFVEPLYHVVVRTPQELPDKPWHRQSVEVDAEWVWLIEQRMAFPQDLLETMAVEGRLVRASEAPRWARRAANTYAMKTQVDARDGWILLDGDTPETYGAAATLWFAAAGAPLIPIVLLALALLRRRRRGPGPRTAP